MPVVVQQNVVQLQISIDDATAVEVEQTDRYFGGVESARKVSFSNDVPYQSYTTCCDSVRG